MSTKVCREPVNPEWSDTTTIGTLLQMIGCLIGMGNDENTPVTYLYDGDHVWLETVHDIEDEKAPRVVHELGPDECDTDWTASDGSPRHWDGVYWRNPLNGAPYCGDFSCGPYTEVLP